MNAKLQNTPSTWVDPDDAPELTDEDFARAVWRIGNRIVPREEAQAHARAQMRRGRPKAERPKIALTVRYDADVVDAFRATGTGWQTRMNGALREWLANNKTVKS